MVQKSYEDKPVLLLMMWSFSVKYSQPTLLFAVFFPLLRVESEGRTVQSCEAMEPPMSTDTPL